MYLFNFILASDCPGVDLANVKMSMNPFCEIAVEEAIRLKEQKKATEVCEDSFCSIMKSHSTLSNDITIKPRRFFLPINLFSVYLIQVIAISIGPKASQETLRTALAMGADKGIHITTDARADLVLQPLAIAKIIAKYAAEKECDMVIVGKQAIDGDNAQTGPMVAGLLGWSQGTFAAGVEVGAKVCSHLYDTIIS